MSAYLKYQHRRPPGDGRMGGWRGRQRKGCELIRFLSLHAPLPVLLLLHLLLSNPCGQRGAAQRLDSRTQWGNNWYKRQLAADETLSVIQSDTVSAFPTRLHLKELPVWFKSFFIRSSLVFLRSFLQDFHISFRLLIKWRLALFLSSDALFLFYFFRLKLLDPPPPPSNTLPSRSLVSPCVSVFLLSSSSLFRVTCRRMGCVNGAIKNTLLCSFFIYFFLHEKKRRSCLQSLWCRVLFLSKQSHLCKKRGWKCKTYQEVKVNFHLACISAFWNNKKQKKLDFN